MDAPRRAATFIVRVFRDAGRELVGSVQRARTGERRPFYQADAIGRLITEMTEIETPDPGVSDVPEPPPADRGESEGAP